MYKDFRDRCPSSAACWHGSRHPSVFPIAGTERANGDLVSGNYFEVLGIQPFLGRTFTQERRPHTGGALSIKPGVSRKEAEASANVLYHQILEQELKETTEVNQRFSERFVRKHLFPVWYAAARGSREWTASIRRL